MNILEATLLAFAVGALGTAGGAAITLLIKTRSKKISYAMMAFSSGIMLMVVGADMIPHSIETAGEINAVIALAVGGAAAFFIEKIIPHSHEYESAALRRVGVAMCGGVALHNLPEGLAIGAAIGSGNVYGYSLALLLLLHNIPEGMALAAPFKLSGMKNSGTLLFALAVGAPTAVGAAIGSAIGDISQEIPGICIGIGAGAMAVLTVKELLPLAFKEKNSGSIVCLIVGAAVGAAMVLAL